MINVISISFKSRRLSSLSDLQLQKKFDANQIQSRQLFLHNEQLKSKCHQLEEKLEQVERKNVQLIQRFTQQVDSLSFSHFVPMTISREFFCRIFGRYPIKLDGCPQTIDFFFEKKSFPYELNSITCTTIFPHYSIEINFLKIPFENKNIR